MIPQRLEKVLASDFSFLTFGEHPESLLYAETSREGDMFPTFVFGPEDDKSELNVHLKPGKTAMHKVAELYVNSGIVSFCLSPEEHYKMHLKRETMPTNLDYQSVSWDELMMRAR